MNERLIRTFLCVPVPVKTNSIKTMLYSTIDNSKFKINWVRNSNLHLTIKFIGQTPKSSLKEIIYDISNITSNIKPFNLKISETGCFPNDSRPKALWLGIIDKSENFNKLVSKIENSLFKIGFEKDKKIFTPHITIARINYPQKLKPDIQMFLNSSYDEIDLDVHRVQFFSSELLSNGAIYSLLKTFPLGETI
tara:strand:+ start:118 stop:696 length:579 start_codon:yes stop_codon:yes gene_type:complete